MEDLDFTLLEENQIFGEERLSIFDKYGEKAAITDFAILLGGYVSNYQYTNEGNDRTGWWWTKTDDGDNDARVVGYNGNRSWNIVIKRDGGARPVLPYSLIQSIASSVVRSANEIKEVEYGEYPQTIAPENISSELERAYNNESLRITGKNYTTDSVRYQDYNTSFKARTHSEYEYNGERYIRFVGDSNCDGEVLSDGRTVHLENVYWVHVEPIIWLVDKERDIAVSKKLLFSGVQFNNKQNYKGDFDKVDLHYFLKNYFSKDIIPSKVEVKMKENAKKYYRYKIRDFNKTYWNSINASRSFLVGLSIPFMAYEEDGILRDVLTGLPIVPEDVDYISDDAIVYNYLEVTDASDVYDNILLIVQELKQKNELYVPILEKEYIKYISELLKSDELEKYSQNIIENKTDEYILSMRNKNNQ